MYEFLIRHKSFYEYKIHNYGFETPMKILISYRPHPNPRHYRLLFPIRHLNFYQKNIRELSKLRVSLGNGTDVMLLNFVQYN